MVDGAPDGAFPSSSHGSGCAPKVGSSIEGCQSEGGDQSLVGSMIMLARQPCGNRRHLTVPSAVTTRATVPAGVGGAGRGGGGVGRWGGGRRRVPAAGGAARQGRRRRPRRKPPRQERDSDAS